MYSISRKEFINPDMEMVGSMEHYFHGTDNYQWWRIWA